MSMASKHQGLIMNSCNIIFQLLTAKHLWKVLNIGTLHPHRHLAWELRLPDIQGQTQDLAPSQAKPKVNKQHHLSPGWKSWHCPNCSLGQAPSSRRACCFWADTIPLPPALRILSRYIKWPWGICFPRRDMAHSRTLPKVWQGTVLIVLDSRMVA